MATPDIKPAGPNLWVGKVNVVKTGNGTIAKFTPGAVSAMNSRCQTLGYPAATPYFGNRSAARVFDLQRNDDGSTTGYVEFACLAYGPNVNSAARSSVNQNSQIDNNQSTDQTGINQSRASFVPNTRTDNNTNTAGGAVIIDKSQKVIVIQAAPGSTVNIGTSNGKALKPEDAVTSAFPVSQEE